LINDSNFGVTLIVADGVLLFLFTMVGLKTALESSLPAAAFQDKSITTAIKKKATKTSTPMWIFLSEIVHEYLSDTSISADGMSLTSV
jgi:hypothetical protein